MDSNIIFDAAVYLLLVMSVPYLAVQSFYLIRDDCSRTPLRSRAPSSDILGDTS